MTKKPFRNPPASESRKSFWENSPVAENTNGARRNPLRSFLGGAFESSRGQKEEAAGLQVGRKAGAGRLEVALVVVVEEVLRVALQVEPAEPGRPPRVVLPVLFLHTAGLLPQKQKS